jgi:glycosyltransferase involved in cell wall biosynthesis
MVRPAPELAAVPGGLLTEESPEVSVVIPAYNEAPSLELIAGRIRDVLEREQRSYEIIFVDDGSRDESWNILKRIHLQDPRVRVRRLDGQQGKSAALSSGFRAARGGIVVTMDADLQDLPEEIPILIAALEKDSLDLVQAWRSDRHDSAHKVFASSTFNTCCSLLSGLPLRDINCGFKAMRSEVARRLSLETDMHRFIPILVHRSGARVAEVSVRHARRAFGQSKYGLMRYLHGIRGLLTVVLIPRLLGRTLPALSTDLSDSHPSEDHGGSLG